MRHVGDLHELGPSECRARLGEHQLGRLVVVAPDGPHIIPVNYALVDETIVFRTSPFTLVAMHAPNASVAFEVDHLDQLTRTGWSVLVRGRTSRVLDRDQISHIRRIWEPVPWADGTRNLYIRLTPTQVTGRRIGAFAPVPGSVG